MRLLHARRIPVRMAAAAVLPLVFATATGCMSVSEPEERAKPSPSARERGGQARQDRGGGHTDGGGKGLQGHTGGEAVGGGEGPRKGRVRASGEPDERTGKAPRPERPGPTAPRERRAPRPGTPPPPDGGGAPPPPPAPEPSPPAPEPSTSAPSPPKPPESSPEAAEPEGRTTARGGRSASPRPTPVS